MLYQLFGCDLLEKSYLCGIQNNFSYAISRVIIVVICLKNRTFAVYKTTGSDTENSDLQL